MQLILKDVWVIVEVNTAGVMRSSKLGGPFEKGGLETQCTPSKAGGQHGPETWRRWRLGSGHPGQGPWGIRAHALPRHQGSVFSPSLMPALRYLHMVEVWGTEEPGKVARDRSLPLGTVRGGLAWRTWILPAAGPSFLPHLPLPHAPQLHDLQTKCTWHRQFRSCNGSSWIFVFSTRQLYSQTNGWTFLTIVPLWTTGVKAVGNWELFYLVGANCANPPETLCADFF